MQYECICCHDIITTIPSGARQSTVLSNIHIITHNDANGFECNGYYEPQTLESSTEAPATDLASLDLGNTSTIGEKRGADTSSDAVTVKAAKTQDSLKRKATLESLGKFLEKPQQQEQIAVKATRRPQTVPPLKWCFFHNMSDHSGENCDQIPREESDSSSKYNFNMHGRDSLTNSAEMATLRDLDGFRTELELIEATFVWSSKALVNYSTHAQVRDAAFDAFLDWADVNQGQVPSRVGLNIYYLMNKICRYTETDQMELQKILKSHINEVNKRLAQNAAFSHNSEATSTFAGKIEKLVAGPGGTENWMQPEIPSAALEKLGKELQSWKHGAYGRRRDIQRDITDLVMGDPVYRKHTFDSKSIAYDCLQLAKNTMMRIETRAKFCFADYPPLQEDLFSFEDKYQLGLWPRPPTAYTSGWEMI